jgi:CubicO group peptidase (beta-lactamase class C family)
MRRTIVFGILLALPLHLPAQAPFEDFDDYVTEAMALWEVPGLAVAVVRDGEVAYAKGYGVRTIDTDEVVDEHTIFAIGSSSKAFTAAAIGMLVDAGEVSWGDQAAMRLPGFELYDDYASQEMNIRDLLSHRSGLSRGDLLWYASDLSRDEIVRRVRFLEPSWSFRARFGYQNIMYLAAGELLEEQSGMTWDAFVAQRIFLPLGMTRSNTSVTALASVPNVATPHAEIDDTLRAISYRNIDNMAPAGSINSSVVDVAQWILLHLNEGKFDGERILSSSVVQQMQTPNTLAPLTGPSARIYEAANFRAYGMGWFLQDHRGHKLVHHGGNIDGMSAMVALMPEENAGVVILTNKGGTFLRDALMLQVMDAIVGHHEKNWSTETHAAIQPFIDQNKLRDEEQEAKRVMGTQPSHELSAYTGAYADPDSLYGELEVTETTNALVVSYGGFVGPLEHWHYDTFRATWEDPTLGKSYVTFAHDHEGEISQIDVEGLAEFDRKPEVVDSTDAVALSREQLEAFVGRYSADEPPLDLSIEMMAGRLQVVIPGQPAYRIAAQSETEFRLTGIPIEVTLAFTMEQGRVAEVALTQQGRTFTLAKVE